MTNALRKHPLLKLLSIAAAFALWWTVRGERLGEISVLAKVEVRNVPENLTISGDVEREVRLKVAGPRSRLRRVQESPPAPIVIDLSEGRHGVNARSLYGEDFRLPHGVRVTHIVPEVIRIDLDEAEERLVKVEPRFVGVLSDGWEMVGHETTPPYLKVRAARTELAGIDALETEPVSLSDRHETFEGVYGVRGIRPAWGTENRKVTVRVRLREKEVSKIVEDVPVTVAGVTRGVRVDPGTVALRLRGPAGKVSSLLGERMEVSVDGKALGLDQQARTQLRVRPVVPTHPGVEITMIPDNVRLTLSPK